MSGNQKFVLIDGGGYKTPLSDANNLLAFTACESKEPCKIEFAWSKSVFQGTFDPLSRQITCGWAQEDVLGPVKFAVIPV
jgi:hypothetical protein